MILYARKRNQRTINSLLVGLMLMGSLTASVPFIFNQKAHAAGSYNVSVAAVCTADHLVTLNITGDNISGSDVYVKSSADFQFSAPVHAAVDERNVAMPIVLGQGSIPAGGVTIYYSTSEAGQYTLLNDPTATASYAAIDCNDYSNIYVSNSGNDTTNNGETASTPFATIQKALDTVATGGTVHVANGTYTEKLSFTKGSVTVLGESEAGTIITPLSNQYGYGFTSEGQGGITISNLTVDGTATGGGAALKFHNFSGLTLSTINVTGISTPHSDGIDINGVSDVSLNKVNVSGFGKNGIAVTALYSGSDVLTQNVGFNNVRTNNNSWAGLAFYNSNNAGTVAGNITGVTFTNANQFKNNGEGVFFEGDTDANHVAHLTPRYIVSGVGNVPVDLGNATFSGNGLDIDNYQTTNVNATSTVFGTKTGNQMYASEQAAENNLIIDQIDYSTFGKVTYYSSTVLPAVPSGLSWVGSNNQGANNGYTNIQKGTLSWQDSTPAEVDHYIYKFWTNIPNYHDGENNAWQTSDSTFITKSLTGGSIWTDFANQQGTYYFCVEAVDGAGNASACSTALTITYDSTVPVAPTITAPGARSWFNKTPIVDKWTAVTADLSGINHYQIAYGYDDGHLFDASTCPGVTIPGHTGFIGCRDVTGTQRNHTPGANEQGGVTIWVRAIDNAGNVGAWSKPVNYHYDTVAATTTIAVGSLTNGVTGNQFTVSGDASDNLALNRVYVQLINKTTGARFGGTMVNLIPNGKTGNWSVDYNAISSGMPNGDYYAVATATDMAGNSTTTQFLPFAIAPTLTVSDYSGPSLTPTITGTTNGSRVTVGGIATTVNGDGSWSYTFPQQAIGTHPFTVVATDKFGNSTSQLVTVTVSHPLTQPTTPSVTAAPTTATSTTTTTTVTPTGTTSTNTADQSVLGDATTTPSSTTPTNTSGVKGDSTTNKVAAATTNSNKGNIFGLAWYWWLLILAVLAGIWWVIAARRSNPGDEI